MRDAQMLELFFARKQEALEQVRVAYGAKLIRLAENLLGSRQDAEECLNDTLLAAWNSIPPQRPQPLLPWLYTTVRNLALKKRRGSMAQRRGGGMFPLAYEELSETLAGSDTPQEAVDRTELIRLLNRFLARLSGRDRALFLGRYWYGESYEVIARRLGMTEHNCAVRLSRIRGRLREYLIKEGAL